MEKEHGERSRSTGTGRDEAASTLPASVRPRLMIVDDEPMIGTTLSVLLSDDFQVVLARSGEEAQRLLEESGDFEAVVCDLMMPRISGMDLFRWLEAKRPELAPRVVFMTGGVFTDEARDFLSSVQNPRLEKPFDHDELITLLREL